MRKSADENRSLHSGWLRFFAWVCIAEVVLAAAALVLTIVAFAARSEKLLVWLYQLAGPANAVTRIASLVGLKLLLNRRFDFTRTDLLLRVLMIWCLFDANWEALITLLPEGEGALNAFAILGSLAIGVVTIVLGARLRRLKDKLRGRMGTCSGFLVAEGALRFGYLFGPLGRLGLVIAMIGVSIALARVFFQAARE